MFNQLAKAFKNNSCRKFIIAITLFIFANALKTTLFNFFLIPQMTRGIFIYKLCYTFLLIVIIYSLVFSFKSKYVFLVVYALQAIYTFVNISYYLYYHSYLHFLQWISLFKEALISASHFANPASMQLLTVFIDLPIAIYIFFTYFKPEVRKIKLSAFKYLIILPSLIILLILEANNYYAEKSIIQYLDDRYAGETVIVERYGTLVNGAINIFKNSSESKLAAQISYGRRQTGESKLTSGSPSNDPNSVQASRPNFVMVQVESMDSNIVMQQYKDKPVMPFLSSLRENSIYYPYMLSYHKGGGTSDTEFSVINSVEPLDSFPAIKLASYSYPNSLVSKLAKASYATIAFHGNIGTFYNRDIALSKMGFNKFYDINNMNYEDEGWGAPDDKVFSFAFDKMTRVKQPFLAYIITMTSHGPFESARNYYNNPRYDDIEDETVRNYYNSFNYVDDSLRDFVQQIQAKYDNTYVFIYGDHTPNISTEDFFQASFIEVDKYLEFVPLFIITPDNKKYVETSQASSFLDISPTILQVSGIPYNLYSDGINLIRNQSEAAPRIPLKGADFDRSWLYDKISKHRYSEEEPLWWKYLPSFISSNLIEKHRK